MKQILRHLAGGSVLIALPLLAAAQNPTNSPTAPPPDTQGAQATQITPPRATAAPLKDGKLALNEDASHYVKLTLANQVWLRYNQSNPGTQVNGYARKETFDVGIRRFRIQFYGQLTDRVFIYSQIGINNFSYLSDRKAGFFLHDAVGEYSIAKNYLSLGTGLGAWNGLSRATASSVGSIMGIDLPLVAETTNDVNDQFGRKLSLYAKGKLGRLDYRVALSKPLIIPRGTAIASYATFSSKPPKPQVQGYFQWQFKDLESNLTPYSAGTYLGKKRVFNLGAGFIVQPQATWTRDAGQLDTTGHAMKQFAVDAFYDAPVSDAPDAPSVSFYATAMHLDYGPRYLRYTAPMNPANGLAASTTNQILGAGGTYGNAVPLYGTGNVLYAQAGYKLKDNLLGTTTLMPYASYQYAHYQRLADNLHYYDVGVNWLLVGHTSKFTVSYQNRPVYLTQTNGDNRVSSRRSAVVMQYQVYFN
ncbi:hypothetical protein [Hymenobacter sp. GOD-10R]|uniref:hypothetical protein n=1 Tax=Hymenobacter sp. GOD-10R TaxID=3093922 RepID=UPI002D79C271|nr:hypothetical protein [Hymenobacter sp. GOD-10R]WRQ26981.1 hypothetical protein SD425_18070 [Hymenobacter sp. GOD-10R]